MNDNYAPGLAGRKSILGHTKISVNHFQQDEHKVLMPLSSSFVQLFLGIGYLNFLGSKTPGMVAASFLMPNKLHVKETIKSRLVYLLV